MTSNIPENLDPIVDMVMAYFNSTEFAAAVEMVTEYVPLEDLENAYTALEEWVSSDFLPGLNWAITYENFDEDGFRLYAMETNTGVEVSLSETSYDGGSAYEVSLDDSLDVFGWDGFSAIVLDESDSIYASVSFELDGGEGMNFTVIDSDAPLYFLTAYVSDPVESGLSDEWVVNYAPEVDLPWSMSLLGNDGSFDWDGVSIDLLDGFADYYPLTVRSDADMVTFGQIKLDNAANIREARITYGDGVEYTATVSEGGQVTETFLDVEGAFDWSAQSVAFDESGLSAEAVVEMDNGVKSIASASVLGGTAQMYDLADAFDWAATKASVGADGEMETLWTRFDDGTTAYVSFAETGASHVTVKDNSNLYDWDRVSVYSNAQGGVSARSFGDDGSSAALTLANIPFELAAYDLAAIESAFVTVVDDVFANFA